MTFSVREELVAKLNTCFLVLTSYDQMSQKRWVVLCLIFSAYIALTRVECRTRHVCVELEKSKN